MKQNGRPPLNGSDVVLNHILSLATRIDDTHFERDGKIDGDARLSWPVGDSTGIAVERQGVRLGRGGCTARPRRRTTGGPW